MQRSEQSIRTSHVGMLPGGAQSHSGSSQGAAKPAEDMAALTSRVAGIVKRQRDLGIDCVGDGEFWTGRHFRFYGQQLSGITSRELRPGERASGRESTRERDAFPKLYADMDRVGTAFCVPGEQPRFFPAKDKMVVTEPIKCRATDAIQREIKVFKEALAAVGGVEEAFICVYAPGWLDHFIYDEYYNDDEKFVFALADAMREEYRAVVDAGFILQIDDPGVVDWWDMLKPALSVEAYRDRFAKLRIDAVNHAIAGLPADRIRYHLCWGSWHGPHTHDLPFEHVIGLMLQVNAQCYSFEAANVRHEHEWRLWERTRLPDGKIILPGVVSHSTNLVEHPELIADRIVRFARCVGRENVLAGTDCGLGGRVHAEIAWAKLGALVEGARLASKRLWR